MRAQLVVWTAFLGLVGTGEGCAQILFGNNTGPQPGQCETDADCPDSDPCSVSRCDLASHLCEFTNLDPTTVRAPEDQQVPGDCRTVFLRCGTERLDVADDTDLPDDGRDCTADACAAGKPTHTPKAAGTACTDGAGIPGTCDAEGDCGTCTVDCSPYLCASGTCGTSCANDTQCVAGHYCDGMTPGACQPQKASGATCFRNGECTSGSCVAGVCG